MRRVRPKRRQPEQLSLRQHQAAEYTRNRRTVLYLWLSVCVVNVLLVLLLILRWRTTRHIHVDAGFLVMDVGLIVLAVVMTLSTRKG